MNKSPNFKSEVFSFSNLDHIEILSWYAGILQVERMYMQVAKLSDAFRLCLKGETEFAEFNYFEWFFKPKV